jgi:hypothetical protein
MLTIGWKQAAIWCGGVALVCWLLRPKSGGGATGTVVLGDPVVTGKSSIGNDYLTTALGVDVITGAS